MKDFLKNVSATVVGIFISISLIIIFGILSLVSITSSMDKTPKLKDNSILVLKISGNLTERGSEDLFNDIFGIAQNEQGLNEILKAIKIASENDKIKGIYLDCQYTNASYASIKEIRDELTKFKSKGKWIVSYADTYTQNTYYLASVANEIYLNPQGMLDWHGIGAQPYYIKDLADKLGIKFQVVKVCTFKSATEMFTENKMSDANRIQSQIYINGIWSIICNAVSKSRNIDVKKLNQYADNYLAFVSADSIKQYNFIDKLIYRNEVKKEIKSLLKIEEDETIPQINVKDILKTEISKEGNIAIYYAEGTIIQNTIKNAFTQDNNIIADDICNDLENLANDNNIKAVVLRINSPGGDAYASEQIWHQVVELKKKKPVVVSMGTYAASGGYYIGCGASWIVAQDLTLTGSIGIFGVFPDMSKLTKDKLGIHFDEVKTNKNSTFGNPMARPFNINEISLLQKYINKGYATFLKRVSDGRGLTITEVDKIAQGRVWIGIDAKKIKLVDEIGGINTAIKKAAELAELKEYNLTEYQKNRNLIEQLFNVTDNDSYIENKLKLLLGNYYEAFSIIRDIENRSPIQARMEQYLNIK